MRIYAVVLTTTVAPDQPVLIEAWDEVLVQADPTCWRRVVAEEAIGEDVAAVAGVVLEIPTDALLTVLNLAPPVLRATVAPADPTE